MSSQRYERVSNNDDDTPISAIPSSPPPSFRSVESSPTSRHFPNDSSSMVDQNLADTFDADGSDSDEENDGDDRQRLMRGNPTSPYVDQSATSSPNTVIPPPQIERRVTSIPVFTPQPTSGRIMGGGSGSDGVFSNLSAKPEAGEKLEEHPPTYEQAAADAAPPYWETTILAPGLGGPDEVYVEGLPVGSVFSFIWNAMISMSFQFVGFLLTYLLHTTHAAKNGSRAGLGITLVQYGFFMKGNSNGNPASGQEPQISSPPDPNAHDFDPNQVTQPPNTSDGMMEFASGDWLAYVLMIVGWFILIRAVSDFIKVRRHEQLILQSPDRGLPVPIIATNEESETVV